MRDSMRRWLMENGIDPDDPEVANTVARLEGDFAERMERTQQLTGGRCSQTCDPQQPGDRFVQCVLDAGHTGPHEWGAP